MTNSISKTIVALAFAVAITPAIAGTKITSSPIPGKGGINCSSTDGVKWCVCKGTKSCNKLSSNCVHDVNVVRPSSGGVYGKCDNLINPKSLGFYSN